jgi:hypothetical protein
MPRSCSSLFRLDLTDVHSAIHMQDESAPRSPPVRVQQQEAEFAIPSAEGCLEPEPLV